MLMLYGEALLYFYLKKKIKNIWTENSECKQNKSYILTSLTVELVHERIQCVRKMSISLETQGCQFSGMPRVCSARDTKMGDSSILWTGWCASLHDQPEYTVKVVPAETEANEGYLDSCMSSLKETLCDQ